MLNHTRQNAILQLHFLRKFSNIFPIVFITSSFTEFFKIMYQNFYEIWHVLKIKLLVLISTQVCQFVIFFPWKYRQLHNKLQRQSGVGRCFLELTGDVYLQRYIYIYIYMYLYICVCLCNFSISIIISVSITYWRKLCNLV